MKLKKFSVELKIKSDENCATDDQLSCDDALSVIGFGKVQILVTLCCGLIVMEVITESMMMSIIMPAAQCDLKLTSTDKGILSAAVFLGIMVSSHLWAYIADTRGRLKISIATITISTCLTISAAFVSHFWLLTLLRFLTGFFISGASAAGWAYIGELNIPRHRPVVVTLACTFIAFATIYLFALGWLILPGTWSFDLYEGASFRPWRLLIIVYTIPGIISLLLLTFLKESPKFLLCQGREEEAVDVINWVYTTNTGRPIKTFTVKKLIAVLEPTDENIGNRGGALAIAKSMWNQTIPLFKPPHLLPICLCSAILFGALGISSGMGMWYPEIINKLATYNSTVQLTVCEILAIFKIEAANKTDVSLSEVCDDSIDDRVYFENIILGFFFGAGFILITFIIKYGRGLAYGVCLLGSGLCGCLMIYLTDTYVVSILIMLQITLCVICVSVVIGTVIDLIPTQFRAMAVCVVYLVGRLGSIVAINVIGSLLETNCNLTFYLTGGYAIVCAVLSFILPSKSKI